MFALKIYIVDKLAFLLVVWCMAIPSGTTSSGASRPQDRSQSKQQRRVYKNDEIKAFKVLLITESGEKVGLFPRDKALEMAQSE